MTTVEDIRAAFAVIADEAPPAERIRSTIDARARQHRQRRLILGIAGVGVAAGAVGLAGLGVLRLLQPDAAFPKISGGPGGGWLQVPLRYGPTWLPGGYGMCSITVFVAGEQAPVVDREWRPAGRAGESMSSLVELLVGWHDTLERNRPIGQVEEVDVNGVAARLIRAEGGGLTYVIWQPSGEPQLIVTVGDDDNDDRRRTTALRVARSVRPDPRFTWVGPRFGWLPAELADVPWQVRVGYHDVAWQQTITIGNPQGLQLVVEIGPNAHNGRLNNNGQVIQAVRVRGLDGRQEPADGLLFFTLPDGIEVLLQCSPAPGGPSTGNPGQSSKASDSAAQLVHIAEKCDFGPWPDMSWIGTTT
jgi:hypothetical protein